jgi:hypothetical protein
VGERGNFTGGFAFLRQRGQEAGLDRRRNFFIGQLIHGLADLPVRERVRLGELSGELLEHGMILRTGNGGLKRKVRLIIRITIDENMDKRGKFRNLSFIVAVSLSKRRRH